MEKQSRLDLDMCFDHVLFVLKLTSVRVNPWINYDLRIVTTNRFLHVHSVKNYGMAAVSVNIYGMDIVSLSIKVLYP